MYDGLSRLFPGSSERLLAASGPTAGPGPAHRRSRKLIVALIAVVVEIWACAPAPNVSRQAPSDGIVAVPLVIGRAAEQAVQTVEAAGLQARLPDAATGTLVLAQSPPVGWLVPAGSVVRLAIGAPGLGVDRVSAAIAAASAHEGGDFVVTSVEVVTAADAKAPDCVGARGCVLVHLTGPESGLIALVDLDPIAVIDIGLQARAEPPPRLMPEDDIIALAGASPEVAARRRGRGFTSSVASGGDGSWCTGPRPFAANYCDTVMVFIDGEPGGPLLVSVNWVTGRTGIAGTAR